MGGGPNAPAAVLDSLYQRSLGEGPTTPADADAYACGVPEPEPEPAPAGWEIRKSTRNGRPFYVNVATQEAAWAHPGGVGVGASGVHQETPTPSGSAQAGAGPGAGAGAGADAGGEAASLTGSPLADHIIQEIKRVPEVAEQLAQSTGRCARENIGPMLAESRDQIAAAANAATDAAATTLTAASEAVSIAATNTYTDGTAALNSTATLVRPVLEQAVEHVTSTATVVTNGVVTVATGVTAGVSTVSASVSTVSGQVAVPQRVEEAAEFARQQIASGIEQTVQPMVEQGHTMFEATIGSACDQIGTVIDGMVSVVVGEAGAGPQEAAVVPSEQGIAQLVAMGFVHEAAAAALVASNNDTAEAVSILLAQP